MSIVYHGLTQPNTQVCYKNKNTLDNRKCNLINRTIKEKVKNSIRGKRKQGKSRRISLPFGVYPTRHGKYQVIVRIDKKPTYLGTWGSIKFAEKVALNSISEKHAN